MTTYPPFNNRLKEIQQQTDSLLCVGIDPDVERLPAPLSRDADGIGEFCRAIISTTSGEVCAYKFNSAFFEVFGARGFELLGSLRELIPPEIICIYDVKRGDIGNTARQYARAAFETLRMDAVTLNPYMGYDAVAPFIQSPDRGAFILCLTSNPGSDDFQRQHLLSDIPLYREVARKTTEWNTENNLGLVIGATQAQSVQGIRDTAPELPMLTPGIGAQGGDLEKVLSAGLDTDGTGVVVPVSRAILYAGGDRNYADRAQEAARQLNRQINEVRHS